jgi:beta-lactamase class A
MAMMAAIAIHGTPAAQPAPPPPAPAATAANTAANTALARRAADAVTVINGGGDPASLFGPAFLAQVPPERMRALAAQLVQQYGRAERVTGITPRGANAGVADIATERGTLHILIAVAADPPHRIETMLVTGAELNGDPTAAVMQEIRALPGTTTVALARLDDDGPHMLDGIEPDRPMAIGSAFKLFVLAELDRQVRAGQRHWSDVVTLDSHSTPSGVLQTWPRGAPVTLQTLATLMISISDNTAADTLLRIAGRENVERMMTTIGVRSAARDRPFLSTLQAFALKAAPPAAYAAWQGADEAGRRAMLDHDYARVDPAAIPATLFDNGPVRIDTLEWFASPADLARTVDWLRRNASDTARAILAVNPGNSALRDRFAYVGYKGGSEPGVLNVTWLLRGRDGAWYAASGSWNNPAAALDEGRFLGLMARAAGLLAAGS